MRSSRRVAARKGSEKKVGATVAVDRRQLKKRGAKAIKKSKKASKRDKNANILVEAAVAVTMKNKTKRDNKTRQAKGKVQTLEDVAGASLQTWKNDQLTCLLLNLDCEHGNLTKVPTVKKDLIKGIKKLEHLWMGLSTKELAEKCKGWFKLSAKKSKLDYLRYLIQKSFEEEFFAELSTFEPKPVVKDEGDTSDEEGPKRGQPRKKGPKATEAKKKAIHSARKTVGRRNEDFVDEDEYDDEEEEEEQEENRRSMRTRSRGGPSTRQVKVEKASSRSGKKSGRLAASAVAKKEKGAAPSTPERRIKREPRKATEGVKYYSQFAYTEDIGTKNYEGHFTQQKLGGVLYDGFVVDKLDDENPPFYSVQISCLLGEDGDTFEQKMTPLEVSECVVPFEKMLRRDFFRVKRSGEILKGKIVKYLGNVDPKKREYVHCFDVHYHNGESEVLTNYALSKHLVPIGNRQKPGKRKRAASDHPYRKHQRIGLKGEDRMIVNLFFFLAGKMNRQAIEIPSNATVADLKQCIWQASNWLEAWNPDLQTLCKGGTMLEDANKSLEEYGVEAGDSIGIDLNPKVSLDSETSEEDDSEEEWLGSMEHYEKCHKPNSSSNAVWVPYPNERNAVGPMSPNKGVKKDNYIRWTLTETVEFIKLVKEFYEKDEYLHAKMWHRILELAEKKGIFKNNDKICKPDKLRVRWRTLKHTASLDPKFRRGDNALIPENVLEEVLYIRDKLEYDEDGTRKNCRTGK